MLRFILTLLVVLLVVQAFAKDHEQKEKPEKESDDCTHCGKVFTKAFDSYANLTYTTQLEKLRSACESAPIRNRQSLSRMCNGLVEKIEETKEELVDSDSHKAACKKLSFCVEHKSDAHESKSHKSENNKDESKHHNKDENKHHNKDENKHHNKDENKHHNKDENKHHNKDENKHHNKDSKNHNDENDKHKNKENHRGHHNNNNQAAETSACNEEERFTCFRSCDDVDRLMITRCPKISVPSVCVKEIGQWMCPVEVHGHLVIYTPEMYCPVSESCEGGRQIGKVCIGGVYFERQVLSSVFTPDNMSFFLIFASVSLFGLIMVAICRCIACCARKNNNNKYKAVSDPESDMTGLTEKL